MARGPRSKVPFRRRRENKTDYRHRKNLLMSGLPRAVVRCTSRNTIVQFAQFKHEGDVILATANTRELAKLGWKKATGNTSAAYLAGYLAGTKECGTAKADDQGSDQGQGTDNGPGYFTPADSRR